MLKFRITKLEEAEEAYRPLYEATSDGSAFVLKVEGAVAKEVHDEFRTNNINLARERDALKAKFGDLDPDEYRRLKDIEDALKSGKIKGTDAERILEERTSAMQAEHKKALDAIAAENGTLKSKLETLLITDAAIAAAVEKGLRTTAREDLASRAKATFKLKDGTPVAYNGDAEVFGKEGKPMGIAEWIDQQITNAPHLFDESKGTGGKGSQKGGTGDGTNPWKKETFNLTKQSEIFKADPARAERLKAEATAAA